MKIKCDMCDNCFDPHNSAHDFIEGKWVCCAHRFDAEEIAEKLKVSLRKVYESMGVEIDDNLEKEIAEWEIEQKADETKKVVVLSSEKVFYRTEMEVPADATHNEIMQKFTDLIYSGKKLEVYDSFGWNIEEILSDKETNEGIETKENQNA